MKLNGFHQKADKCTSTGIIYILFLFSLRAEEHKTFENI